MTVLGIDTGTNGGLTFLDDDCSIKAIQKMPLISDFPDLTGVTHCFVEKAQAMSKNGKPQGANSNFTTGQRLGELLGFMAAKKIPVSLVHPRTWQAKLLGSKFAAGDSKKKAYEVASQLWPNESFLPTPRCRKFHDGMVDATLIALYGKRYLL